MGVHSGRTAVRDPVTLRLVILRALCVGIGLGVLLAGCASDPEPEPLPPVAAPSASPSLPVVPLPAEATPATAQGAAAFARYYFDLVNAGLSTADSAAVREVSDDGCGGCRALIGAIEEEPHPGERVQGGLFEVLFAESPPLVAGGVIVDLQYKVTEVRVLDLRGKVLRRTPATAPTSGQLRLTHNGDGWTVLGFRGLP